MSQPTRADRRRKEHGNAHTPPPRDPMRAVYLFFAAAVVLLFVGFGIFRWHENQQIASAYATPTPLPTAPGAKPTASPTQLVDGAALGVSLFPKGDAPAGGHGAPIQGILCNNSEGVALHVHQHLALFDGGKQIQIPQYIGFVPNPNPSLSCLYWIHTHDGEGIIHVESPELRTFTLGDFFAVWGEPLSRTDVAQFKGPVAVWLNGSPYTGDPNAIPLTAHQQIVIEVGKQVPPPNYLFPPGD